ncbi:MAG TPA: shikimate dehydrogenase [Desulfobacteraceae bacterium]|nr:shikimate dehydrogenase [Desulfobacteraceae bacterium]
MAAEQITIDGAAETFGIVGNPVDHSLSPVMHNAAFASLGMNCVYIPLPTIDLAKGVQGLRALGFRGVSVTIPHKEEIVRYVDVLDPVAARIGAVNTLVIGSRGDAADRTVYGCNTDWVGANRALGEQIELAGSRVLLLGAGGSARALGYGLLEAGAEIVLANRTAARGEELAGLLGCNFLPLDEVGIIEADVLVNTTSVGMTPAVDKTPIEQRFLHNFSVVMDIVYAPLTTRLLREAAAAGCKVVDGLSMLLYQGAAQFELWTGRDAPVEVMRRVLRERIK